MSGWYAPLREFISFACPLLMRIRCVPTVYIANAAATDCQGSRQDIKRACC